MMNKGWGQKNMNYGMDGGNGQWYGAQSYEELERYMKWCENRKMMEEEQKQRQELLDQFQKAEAAREREMEKARMDAEAKDKRESMMADFRMMRMKLNELSEYDDAMDKFNEMKHYFMFSLTMEFLKFCKCSDFTEELQRYLMHGDMAYKGDVYFDIDDLEGFIDTDQPARVAQAIANESKVNQIKSFYGGLAYKMCQGGRAYIEQVRQWEMEYKFLDMH